MSVRYGVTQITNAETLRHLLLLPCGVLLQSLPVPHQTLLFSATMPKEIEQLAAQYLNKPVKVKIGRVSVPTANVAQTLQRCAEGEKVELLVAMLQVGTAVF
jgi:superfamily II DNA/RNA helicase